MTEDLLYQEYLKRENEILHAPYNPELEFYSYVQAGDVKKVTELCNDDLHKKEGLGILSDNFLRHIKYHFVITTALVARYCIEGGMEMSSAYSLSDFYINKADQAIKPETISELHKKMCIDYTKRMQELRKQKVCSPHIAKALDYIYDNLHTKISVPVLAAYIGINESYLSRLFKQETGQSITTYIQNKRIDTAKNMLIYSDHSISQIAHVLAFPSQSYFTELFKNKVGMTPAMFRAENQRKIPHSKDN